MMKKTSFLLAFLVWGLVSVSAQKYGHLNFGLLVSSLPETSAADSEMSAYQKQLTAKGEDMAKSWQEKAKAFGEKVQSGAIAPVEQAKQQGALEDERNKILQYQDEVSQKMEQKRQELLKPIIDRAEAAIKEVAQENGYVMIFDTSVFNSILFAKDGDDVLPLVKAKLGIE
ncbi:MAG: OmpH family outer membrane protein [Phaeodactylibacter sp.]|nr:OmpH family outer membrane protein [Phaeodactylibacter sp.]MCB9272600.1 OmpH family outer membrane protein [Lewinellaceae bacterium]